MLARFYEPTPDRAATARRLGLMLALRGLRQLDTSKDSLPLAAGELQLSALVTTFLASGEVGYIVCPPARHWIRGSPSWR